ncbi:MAG: hypothetical protein NW237_11800 [Cyanobacteriota bacterium]|nr:hypothetical protein [Cyanobacteriota bacterium]
METPEEQLKILKTRVRNLERSLAESEALSLEQIECTHRLEKQLLEAQSQIEARDQAIIACQQEQAQLTERPTLEAYQLQSQHIQELQQMVWQLERRPSVEHYQVLQQQLATSQSEIEMLKSELQRRVDPSRFYQLQQELGELKDYANQLGEYAARLPQVQLQHAQSQLHSHELETQLSEMTTRLQALEERPTPEDVAARLHAIQQEHQASLQTLTDQLTQAQQQLTVLQERPDFEQVQQWQQQFEHLQRELAASEADRAALATDLAKRPSGQVLEALQQQVEELRTQLEMAQTTHTQLQAELSQRPASQELETLREELQQLQAAHEQLRQEAEQRPTLTEWQESKRRQELAEAHHIVSKKQIERLQQQIEELKAECVQAHAYAQTQEKEVALLEAVKQDLESRLRWQQGEAEPSATTSPPIHLPTMSPTARPGLPQLEVLPSRSGFPSPRFPESQPAAQGQEEAIPVAATATGRPAASGIPPLTLAPAPQVSDSLLRRRLMGEENTLPSPSRPKSTRSIELPAFVQRRPR